jgi:hypothetical protein
MAARFPMASGLPLVFACSAQFERKLRIFFSPSSAVLAAAAANETLN